MKRYPIIILAGGEKGPLFEPTGYLEKARIPIHGRAMVEWVVQAFHECPRAGDLVVVGSSRLDELPALAHVRRRLCVGANVVQNLLHAITYVKHRVYRSAARHDGYVISFCDAVFLTPEVIDSTLATIESADADVVLHYVDRRAFEAAGLLAQRTYLPVGDRRLTGSTIYYVRKFSKLFGLLPLLAQLRKHRKDPDKMFEILGCRGTSLEDIERSLSERLSLKIKICVSPHPELGLDVDKPPDLELAQQVLGERLQDRGA
jgi:molybdopterin-guanine dinucleotide biosynthesis protein A